MCLDETRNVATIQAKLKLAFRLIIIFYFSVVIQSGEFLASEWQEDGDFEVLTLLYPNISNYSVFAVLGESAVILQYM